MTSTPRKLLHVAALTAAVAALAGCPEKPPAPKAASVAAAPLPDFFEVWRRRRALSAPVTVDELPRDAA